MPDGIGFGKLGDIDQPLTVGGFECIENILLEQRFETAFFRHPGRFGFKEALKRIAGRIVAEFFADCADGGEESLIQLGAVVQTRFSGDVGPGAFCSMCQDLLIGGILLCCLPG